MPAESQSPFVDSDLGAVITLFLMGYLSWKQHISNAESQSQRVRGRMAVWQLDLKKNQKQKQQKNPNPALISYILKSLSIL